MLKGKHTDQDHEYDYPEGPRKSRLTEKDLVVVGLALGFRTTSEIREFVEGMS